MANKPLKSIKFPGLNDTYTIPQVDNTLAVSGAAADAKKTGDAIGDLKSASDNVQLNNRYLYSQNYFDHAALQPNKYCENGQIKSYNGWSCSGLVKIPASRKVTIFTFENGVRKTPTAHLYVDCYKSDGTHVGNSTYRNTLLENVTFPADAAYFYVSGDSEYFTQYTIITDYVNNDKIENPFEYGALYIYDDKRIDAIDTELLASDGHVVRSINRLGYNVYSSSTPPQQSIASYKMAYKKGFRILLCDLRFTSNKVPVLSHDDSVSYARNPDGTTPSTAPVISTSTYAQLSAFDYGIYKGAQYAGTKLMTLGDMCKLCRQLGCELYIECKTDASQDEIDVACETVMKFGMDRRTTWAAESQVTKILSKIPYARIGLPTGMTTISDNMITQALSFRNDENDVFFFGWNSVVLNDATIKKLVDNGFAFEMGTVDTEQGIIDYFAQGDNYYYCTGISSNVVVASHVLSNV